MGIGKYMEMIFIGLATLTAIMLYGNVLLAGKLVVMGFSVLSFYYLLSGALVLFDPKVERSMRILYFVGLWTISTGLLGCIFRLLFWINNELLLLMASLFGVAVLFVSLVYQLQAAPGERRAIRHQLSPLFKRILVYPALFFLLYATSVETLYRNFGTHRLNEEYIEVFLDAYYHPEDSLKQELFHHKVDSLNRLP